MQIFIVSIHQWKPITPSATFNFSIYSLEKYPNYPQTGGAESIISSTLLPWCILIKDNFGKFSLLLRFTFDIINTVLK